MWVANDHWLKAAWPGPVTGILSDVAGLVVVPLALQAAWELVEWVLGRWPGPSTRSLAFTIVLTGVVFSAVQLLPAATDAYRWGLGALQWPARVVIAVLGGGAAPAVEPVFAVGDPADLLALPALGLSWWSGRRRVRRPDRAPAAPAP